MKILGKHKVSSRHVRSIAIDCLGLDIVAFNLFLNGIHADESDTTKDVYEEKLSTSLLGLAVAVRTLIYQGVSKKYKFPDINYCGFYESGNPKDIAHVSIKDICDKLIHADHIEREFVKTKKTDQKPITKIIGSNNGKQWVLEISVSLFCESILNWLNSIDTDNM